MTDVASSQETIGFEDLPTIMRRLQEKEFWDLVDLRLDRPNGLWVMKQRQQHKDIDPEIFEQERQQFLCLLPQWLPSFIEDNLFIEMCETELVQDPEYLEYKIRRYYLEAAKYACRISAGKFEGENAKYKPVFQIHYKDFSSRLQHELQSLRIESPDTLKRIVQNAVFRLFKARHKQIFFDYIENEGLNWRFVSN